MADQQQKLGIVVYVEDQATGKLSKVKAEVAGMGATGSRAAAGVRGVTSSVSTLETAAGRAGKALSHAKGQIGGLVSGPLGMLGIAGAAFTLGGALSKSIGDARDFGAAMELIKTQAGASQAEVDSMSASILAMARSVGTAPADLAAGLYHVESAGMRGAQALDVLKVAAEGAKVGGADLESVTNALIASVQSGVGGVSDMSGAMGTLNAIVGSGNMRMQDLADAMGTGVLSTAKNYGVTIQSVGAALASMTDQGIPAIDAATRINSAMRLMAAPTSKAVKELKGIGLSSTQLAVDMRSPGGMLTAITDLKSHLDASGLSAVQQAALIANAFGGKQSGAILTLIGNVDLLKAKTDAVAKGASGFGDAWASAQQQAAFKMDAFNASMSAVGVKLGNELLPSVTTALDGIGGWLDAHGSDLAASLGGAVAEGEKLAGSLVSLGQAAATAWGAIPPEMRDLLVKGLVARQAIKWTFGIDILSPVTGAIGNALKSAVGGLFQRGGSPANPMWTQSVGGGGGLPGAAGGAATAAEGAGAAGAAEGAGAAGLGLAGAAVGIAGILAAFWLPQILSDHKAGPTQASVDTSVGQMSGSQQQQLNAMFGNIPNAAGGFGVSLKGAGKAADDLVLPFKQLNQSAGKTADDMAQGSSRFLKSIPPDIGRLIESAISRVEGRQAGRTGSSLANSQLVVGLLQKADVIAKGSAAQAQKQADLAAIQRQLLAHGDRWGADQVRQLAAILQKRWDNSVTVNVSVAANIAAGKTTTGFRVSRANSRIALADGGAYPAGRPRLVGEHGPELDVPETGGFVFSASQTSAIRSALGGGGVTSGGAGGRDGLAAALEAQTRAIVDALYATQARLAVTPAAVTRAATTQSRYGPPTGSAGGGGWSRPG